MTRASVPVAALHARQAGPDAPIDTGHPAGLLFVVGREYTVHTKDGQRITGVCTMSSPERAYLAAEWGFANVHYRGIQRVDNPSACVCP